MYCAPSLSGPSIPSKTCSFISSNALFMFAMSPVRLSFMMPAISSAVPPEWRNASSYPDTFPIPSVRIIFNAFIESLVKVEPRAAALSASPMSPVALSTSIRISVKSRKFPDESCTAIEVSPILIAPFSIFCVMSRMVAASAVPDSEPLKPWFAIASSKEVVVSTSCPAACKLAAEFLYASPSCAAVVLLLDCA